MFLSCGRLRFKQLSNSSLIFTAVDTAQEGRFSGERQVVRRCQCPVIVLKTSGSYSLLVSRWVMTGLCFRGFGSKFSLDGKVHLRLSRVVFRDLRPESPNLSSQFVWYVSKITAMLWGSLLKQCLSVSGNPCASQQITNQHPVST